jgi:hypothetical protein
MAWATFIGRPGGLRSGRRALGALTALAAGQFAQLDGRGPTFASIRRWGHEQRGNHEQRDGSERHDGGRCGVNCFLHVVALFVAETLTAIAIPRNCGLLLHMADCQLSRSLLGGQVGAAAITLKYAVADDGSATFGGEDTPKRGGGGAGHRE